MAEKKTGGGIPALREDYSVRAVTIWTNGKRNGDPADRALQLKFGWNASDVRVEQQNPGGGSAAWIPAIQPDISGITMDSVPDTEENLRQCICTQCRTYSPYMESRLQALFCSRGRSGSVVQRKGCICSGCPICSQFSLSGLYYCE